MGSTFAIDVPQTTLARLRQGDERAFEQVYRLFERPVYSLAWRMLGDREEAHEVMHDAMLAVIEKIEQYRETAPFWGWLRQIAVNEALMRLRRRKIDYVDELPEPANDDHAHSTPFDALAQHDLVRALDELPVTTRSVVWLYYVEGLTHDEIATSFDRSISFSKSQVMRGTERLRQLLAPTPTPRVAYA